MVSAQTYSGGSPLEDRTNHGNGQQARFDQVSKMIRDNFATLMTKVRTGKLLGPDEMAQAEQGLNPRLLSTLPSFDLGPQLDAMMACQPYEDPAAAQDDSLECTSPMPESPKASLSAPTPPRSILRDRGTPKKGNSVLFISPEVAEFNKDSPVESMTPMAHQDGKALFWGESERTRGVPIRVWEKRTRVLEW